MAAEFCIKHRNSAGFSCRSNELSTFLPLSSQTLPFGQSSLDKVLIGTLDTKFLEMMLLIDGSLGESPETAFFIGLAWIFGAIATRPLDCFFPLRSKSTITTAAIFLRPHKELLRVTKSKEGPGIPIRPAHLCLIPDEMPSILKVHLIQGSF